MGPRLSAHPAKLGWPRVQGAGMGGPAIATHQGLGTSPSLPHHHLPGLLHPCYMLRRLKIFYHGTGMRTDPHMPA